MIFSNSKILTEIGELFGQYKKSTPGGGYYNQKTVDFIDRIKDITGKEYDQLTTNNPAAPATTPNNNPFFGGPTYNKFTNSGAKKYYGWQKTVIQKLQDGNDVYVVAPPGGGKTTPLMGYWLINLFLGGQNGDINTLKPKELFDTKNNFDQNLAKQWSNIFYSLITGKSMDDNNPIPKVLFITPIRVLAYEQAEGFQEFILDLLLLFKSLALQFQTGLIRLATVQDKLNALKTARANICEDIFYQVFSKLNNNDLFNILTNPSEENDKKFEEWAKPASEKLICVKTGGSGENPYNKSVNEAAIIIATYGSAKNFIPSIAQNVRFIVYDEAHLYMPSDFGGTSSQASEIGAASDAYKIVQAVCKSNAQLAFLSGTINPTSARNFSEFLNIRYHRKMVVSQTEPGDPEAVNKTKLQINPDDSLRDSRELVNRIVRWVNKEETGNAIIMFSKVRIEQLVEAAKKQLTQSSINSVNDRGRKNQIEKKIKDFRRALPYMNPGISKEEIEQKVKEFIKKEAPPSQSSLIARIQNKPGASQIQNKQLREAVAYGIGYIFTSDDENLTPADRMAGKEPITEKDKRIVADLFSKGKIYALIATSSIGIGVNVSIRNMYLPSIMQFQGNGKDFQGELSPINKRNLSQLLNRAGRGVTPISGIFTPSESVSYIRNVANMSNENFNEVPAITITPQDDLVMVLHRLHDSIPEEYRKKIYNNTVIRAKTVGRFAWGGFKTGMNRLLKIDAVRNKYKQTRDIGDSIGNKYISFKEWTANKKTGIRHGISDTIDNLKKKFHNFIDHTDTTIKRAEYAQKGNDAYRDHLTTIRYNNSAVSGATLKEKYENYIKMIKKDIEIQELYDTADVEFKQYQQDVINNGANLDPETIRLLMEKYNRLQRGSNSIYLSTIKDLTNILTKLDPLEKILTDTNRRAPNTDTQNQLREIELIRKEIEKLTNGIKTGQDHKKKLEEKIKEKKENITKYRNSLNLINDQKVRDNINRYIQYETEDLAKLESHYKELTQLLVSGLTRDHFN